MTYITLIETITPAKKRFYYANINGTTKRINFSLFTYWSIGDRNQCFQTKIKKNGNISHFKGVHHNKTPFYLEKFGA